MWFFISFLRVITSIAIICFALYYIIFLRKTKQWKQSNIPFVQPLFLIGHKYFLSMRNDSLPSALDRIYWENENNDLVAFFMTVLPVILVRDPELVQKIFVKNSNKTFPNFFVLPEDDIDTQSMPNFASDKTQWKLGRSVLAPAFSPSRIGPHFAKFKTQMERLCYHLEEARRSGQQISAMNFVENFVNDTMFHWNFGEETNSYKERPELYTVFHDFFEKPTSELVIIFAQMCWPALLNYGVKVFKSLKIVRQKYVDFMRAFLEKKMEDRVKNKGKSDDFVDHLISLSHESVSDCRNGKGDILVKEKAEICMRRMTGYALTLLFAGLDSGSQLCVSAIHLLSLHPEYQERIKREIDDVMKEHSVSELTFEVILDLRFTMQCLHETLRLLPLYKFLMRRCSEDFKIPGSNYQFKKGDIFIALPYSMHRDPRYFKDPDKFDPERFSPENKDLTVSVRFIPFGLGPRKCPGFRVGVLQGVMFVASVLDKYEIRPHSHWKQMTAADFDPIAVTNLPKEDLLIDLVPRCTFTN